MSQDVCSFCERDLRKKKRKERETLSILQQCFECESDMKCFHEAGGNDSAHMHKFGSDLND